MIAMILASSLTILSISWHLWVFRVSVQGLGSGGFWFKGLGFWILGFGFKGLGRNPCCAQVNQVFAAHAKLCGESKGDRPRIGRNRASSASLNIRLILGPSVCVC